MLSWLKIRNLALIEEAEIEFSKGLNVISGETGAGKTVLMSALSLLLGDRADKSMIRSGAETCEITALFLLSSTLANEIHSILKNAGIESDINESGELLVRRSISQNSSKSFVCDTACSLQTLKAIGDILIDTHGPHEHQSILKPSVQLTLLDNYAGLENDLRECSEIYENLKQAEQKLADLLSNCPSEEELNFLREALNEIESARLLPQEDETLFSRHKSAANAHDIVSIAGNAVSMLRGSDMSLSEHISSIYRKLRELEKLDVKNASAFMEKCANLKELAEELAAELENYASNIELDAEEFSRLEERIKLVQTLKRRYGPTLEDVFAKAEEARQKISVSENFTEAVNSARSEIQNIQNKLEKKCAAISRIRKAKSAKFAELVSEELKKLGFIKSEFLVEFENATPGPLGSDRIEFMFGANPGEKIKPLRDVASSGEISRVMLALKTVLAESDSVPVLVFDEIDVNIGGITAATVGKELHKLGKSHQVICITHLAQVAAAGDTHFQVEKVVSGERTFTKIKKLELKSRKAEIARMLGGTKAAFKHAEELLSF